MSLYIAIGIGIVSVPVLIGLFKSLKTWPRNTAGAIKAIAHYIKG